MRHEIREYTPADDAACKQLEVSASQFTVCGGLIKAAIVHKAAFDAKARQFPACVLLVAVVDSAVVGVVAVAITRAWAHDAFGTVGYVFDLRVDGRYQRHGIGRSLSLAAEEHAARAGVEYMYLSANLSNAKALRLYSRLGWSAASKRAIIMRPLLCAALTRPARADAAAAAGGGGVRALGLDEAVALTAAAYARRDLAPDEEGWGRLFDSPLYLGAQRSTAPRSRRDRVRCQDPRS